MTKNTHRIKRTGLRRLLASVTALSVVLGNCCFVMAQPEPVYICGYEEHTHTGESGGCYETQKVCGLEENVVHECYLEQGPHEHDDDLCYEYGEPYLDCGVAVEGHLHEDSCYKEVADHDNLLCTEATEVAHEHGDSCVDEEGNEVCDKTVDVVHSHKDDCYGTKTVNTCGIEENHFHDDSCYTRDKNLTCELKEHKCTHEKCWVPAFEGAHKHEKSCDGRVFVCEKPEHEHVDACIQPAEVTALLEKVDALNEIALELRDAKADYEAKTAKVAEIEAEGNAAVDAGEHQEVIDKIMERYLKAEEAKQKALDTMAKAQELFTREWGIVRFEYDQLGGEEHPEYKEMIPAEKLNLIETGVPYDGEEVEVFEMARSVNHSTVGTVAAPNVNIKMFNYDYSINDNLDSLPMTFFNYSDNSEDGKGSGYNDSANHNIPNSSVPSSMTRYYTAGEQLVDNFPTANGVSMQPLFDNSYTSVVKESRSYTDGGYLFTKDSNGYYHFDSKVSAAEAGTNRFTVYNAAVMPNGASGEDATRGHFLPFNNLKNVKANGTRYELDYVSGSDTRNEKADMWVGMTMDFQFMMPKGGKVNNKDMVFEFAGDDDVMVYVDGKLAIDLSGIHKEEKGTINFRTGEVTLTKRDGNDRLGDPLAPVVDRNIYPTKTVTETAENGTEVTRTVVTPFADYTVHTLQFFYLERGGGCSNCEIKFNLPAIPENSLTVIKNVDLSNVTTGNVVGVDAQQYKFRVLDAADDSVFIPAGATYTLKDGDTVVGTRTVGEGGYFTLRDGQRAEFANMRTYGAATDDYYVEEVLPDDLVDAYNEIVYRASSQGGTVEHDAKTDNFTGIRTENLDNDETQIVTFNNKVDYSKLGRLQVTKTVRDGLTGDGQDGKFKINVQLGDETVTLNLAAGETGLITGILPGTEFTITEPNAVSKGYFPTFKVGSETGVVPVYKVNADNTDTTVKVEIENRATYFGLSIPMSKKVDGLALKQTFEDTFNFTATLIDYNAPQAAPAGDSAVAQAVAAVVEFFTTLPAAVENNVAANQTVPSIKVTKAASEAVGSVEVGAELTLKFDKDTPDGVYTYRVTEVPKTGGTYQNNTQVFIIKVNVDQSKEGNARVELLEMKAGDGALSAKVDKLVFVNHRIPQPITVSVVKKWVNNNPAVTQPESVEVQLYVNGAPKGEPVTLTANAENNDLNWKYTWPEGTVYDTEVWTVVEKAVPKYETTYSTRGNTITVTNTSKGIVSPPGGGDDEERGDLQISKITRGDTTFAAEKEFKMKVTLDGNGIPKGTPYKLNGEAVTGGVKTAGIIPMHAGDVVVIEDVLDGTKYTVEEESGNGYFATYTDATGTIAAGKTVKVEVKNHSNNFGVVLNLLKQVVGLEQDGKNYTFDFDLKLIRVDGVPVTDGAADKTSITVKAPEKEVATKGEEVSTRATDEVVQGSGTFELSFNKDTANGVYVYQVTERSTDATVFKANKQVFEVAVKVDQTAEQRAQIISVTNENGKELSKTAPLTFVNTTLTAAPKKLVTVQKAWASVEGVKHPVSVEVQLDVTLDGQTETYKAVLNADNNWTTAWTIDKEATWTVKETKVDGFATADGGTTWTADNTKEYYTAKIAFVQNGDDTVATITNTRNVPGGGGGGNGGGKPPVNIEDNDVPKTDKPDLEEVLGAEDVVAKEDDGMILGAEDEKVEAAETGDNKAIFFAGAGMMAALAGIFALRKKKED